MTKQHCWYSSPTQRFWTCKALIEGRVISTNMEINEVQGWRLAAIIHALAKDYGWPIESEYRGKANIKHYWLRPGTDPATLRYPLSAKTLSDTVLQ